MRLKGSFDQFAQPLDDFESLFRCQFLDQVVHTRLRLSDDGLSNTGVTFAGL